MLSFSHRRFTAAAHNNATLTKTAAKLQKQVEIRQKMHNETKDCYVNIRNQIDTLSSQEEKERVLARVVYKAHSFTHSTEKANQKEFTKIMKPLKGEVKDYKEDLSDAGASMKFNRECRRELAANLARVMYEGNKNVVPKW